MGKIIEAGDLPEQEKVYLKKDFLGWRIVHPYKNADGSINYLNLIIGGKRNAIILIVFLLFAWWALHNYQSNIQEYKDYCENISLNPVAFCQNIGYCDAAANLNRKNYTNNGFDVNYSQIIIDDGK